MHPQFSKAFCEQKGFVSNIYRGASSKKKIIIKMYVR